MNLSNRLRDLRRRRSLEQVASRAAPNRAEHVFVGIVGGEHYDAAALAGEARDAVEAGRVGQSEIQQDHVRMEPRGHSETFIDRAGRSHDIDVAFVFEHSCDALAHDWMVVHDQDSRHYLPRVDVVVFSTGGTITVTVTVVPRPGVLRIVAWPPTRRARSSMPIRPNPPRRAP